MRDYGFKYQVGDVVTHVGFLKPVRQPVVQQFQIMHQTLIVGPSGSQRMYGLCPLSQVHEPRKGTTCMRVQEEHVVLWPGED